MYGDQFDTEWEELTLEEAIRRMYTLGVARKLDAGRPEERDRIEATADTAYTRKVLELAYEEGRQEIRDAAAGRTEADSVEAVLSSGPSMLDDDDAIEATSGERGSFADPPQNAPDAVTLPSALENETDELERVRLPSFLQRDEG